MSLVDIIRMLRNGRQSPVHLIITKLRTREALASHDQAGNSNAIPPGRTHALFPKTMTLSATLRPGYEYLHGGRFSKYI